MATLADKIDACRDPRLAAIRAEMAAALDERAAVRGRAAKAAAAARYHAAGARHRALLATLTHEA